MFKVLPSLLVSALILFTGSGSLMAASPKRGKSARRHTVAQVMATGHRYMERRQWRKARDHFEHVVKCKPSTSSGREALFLSAVCSCRLGDLDFAHDRLSEYLSMGHAKYFDDALKMQYKVAEHFRDGRRRHLFGISPGPRWLPGHEQALEAYDRVIASVPGEAMGAQAFLAKADLLTRKRRYSEAAQAYQDFLLRYPAHEEASQAYLALSDVYLKHLRHESRNSDLLGLAEVHLERYRMEFPEDPHLADAEGYYQEMREVYASALFDTGQFYKKLGKPSASLVYYRAALKQFPDTQIAAQCRQLLDDAPSFEEIAESDEGSKGRFSGS